MSEISRRRLGPSIDDSAILERLEEFRHDDVRWRAGRAFSLAYHPGPDVLALSEEAYRRFSGENALNTEAFPSLRRMSAEVVDVALGWTNAPGGAAGYMTSGGTESLILTVWAAIQRRLRESSPSTQARHELNVVLADSAHAALEKACAYFGVESRRTAVRDDWRADVAAIEASCDSGTILVVGSAPQYPQGVVDDIPALAALADKLKINCHVDACMGGVTLTYMERSGLSVRPWDFRVPGVTSISIDLHKYGYTSKGAGVLLHRSKELRTDQTFVTENWLGGTYGSSGVLGTKSGGPIASAWAVMHHLGDDGYSMHTLRARHTAEAIARHISDDSRLELRAPPDSTLLSFGVRDTERTVHLSRALRDAGWYVDRQGPPSSIHLTVNSVHADVVEQFLADLARCVERIVDDESDTDARADRSSGTYGSID